MSAKKTKNPRMCVACRCHGDPSIFFRIVRKADGEVIIDHIGTANGRGAYVCRNLDCVEFARRQKKFEQSLKIPVPEDIYENLKIIISKENYDE